MKTIYRLSLVLLLVIVAYLGLATRRGIPTHFNSSPIVWSRTLHSQANSIRFSPDNKYLLIAGSTGNGTFERATNGEYTLDYKERDKRVRLWNVGQQREAERLPAKPIFGGWNGSPMLLMPDFKTLITSWGANDIKAIDIRKRRPDKVIPVYNGCIASMDVSPDGKILALGMTREVQFRDTRTYQLLKTYEHGGQATMVSFGTNSRIVRCSWPGMKSDFVDAKTGKRVPTPTSTHSFEVTASRSGNYWINGATLNTVELWGRVAGQNRKLRTLQSTLVEITLIQFSPDEKTLVVGGLSATENPVQFFKIPTSSEPVTAAKQLAR